MKMAKKIIDHTDPGIVMQETIIHLTDEKLKGILLRTYEKAQKDASDKRWYESYGVFLSVAGTLFLTILTSTFNPICGIAADIVTGIVCWICGISAFVGFAAMYMTVKEKIKNDTNRRDDAIKEIFEQHCFKE